MRSIVLPVDHPFFAYNENFHTFSGQHFLLIGAILAIAWLLPRFATKRLTLKGRLRLGRTLAVTISLAVISWTAVRIGLGVFNPKVDLPLDMCNLSALLMPVLMWKPSRRIHEILYFFVLAGTVQAVLTPHLFEGFPNHTFIKYWTVHGGLVVTAVYFTWVFELFPDWHSLLKAFGWLQVYTLAMFGANLLLDANYFYLMGKPPTASLLDVMPSWPWYLLVCELLALVLFTLVFLPMLGVRARTAHVEDLQFEQVES